LNCRIATQVYSSSVYFSCLARTVLSEGTGSSVHFFAVHFAKCTKAGFPSNATHAT